MQDDSLAKHSLLQWIRQTGLHEKLQSALRLGDDSPIVLQVDNSVSTGGNHGTSQGGNCSIAQEKTSDHAVAG